MLEIPSAQPPLSEDDDLERTTHSNNSNIFSLASTLKHESKHRRNDSGDSQASKNSLTDEGFSKQDEIEN